jgi:hypothetical protein
MEMASKDQEIYSNIGLMLFHAAPEDAKLVKMVSKILRDEISCEIQYFYIEENDDEYGFLPNDAAELTHKLGEQIFELSEFYEKQNQPPWKGVECTVNKKNGKFRLEFEY